MSEAEIQAMKDTCLRYYQDKLKFKVLKPAEQKMVKELANRKTDEQLKSILAKAETAKSKLSAKS